MTQPEWLDRTQYPFESRYLEVDGGRLHYLDEGSGPPVVLVHGTPTWSFLYRDLVRELAGSHRVIVPDHLGFGLSDKPEAWGYRPEDHARNLSRLLEELGLSDVVLGVHDFGGPIGLSHAIEHPEQIRGLVLFNTWMWSLRGTSAERMSRLMASPLGRFLYTRLNFSPKVILKAAFGDKRKLTPRVHRHYIEPFPTAAERRGPWVLARELAASSDWYEGLWRRRERIAGKPTLLLWGMKDPAFGPEALERWRETFPAARVVEFAEAGHFVQEEAPGPAAREVRAFLAAVGESV